MVIELAGAALGSSALSVLITQWFNKRKSKADAMDTAMEGTVKWAESMREDINTLKAEMSELRSKYDALIQENVELKIEVSHLRAIAGVKREGNGVDIASIPGRFASKKTQ